jgi:hypothetical protein
MDKRADGVNPVYPSPKLCFHILFVGYKNGLKEHISIVTAVVKPKHNTLTTSNISTTILLQQNFTPKAIYTKTICMKMPQRLVII